MRTSERKTKQDKFLEAYANGSSIRKSCEIAGIGRTTVYEWQKQDAAFAERFKHAQEDGNDLIEDELVRRAVHGYEVPMVSMGKPVFHADGTLLTETRYSDPLMTLLVKARMPEKYRERQQVEHSGSIDTTGAKELLLDKLARLKEQEGQS